MPRSRKWDISQLLQNRMLSNAVILNCHLANQGMENIFIKWHLQATDDGVPTMDDFHARDIEMTP